VTSDADIKSEGEKLEIETTNVVSVEDAVKNALKNGDTMPAFSLPDSKNKTVTSEALLKESNLVVVFYRGGWCPFCNTYLKKLQDQNDKIEAAGGKLVAISAENPDDSLTTEQKHNLTFHVLSDKNLDFARRFGLVYELPATTDEKYQEMGIDLVSSNDMEKPELPISATYIVNKESKIVYSFVNPDYKKRLEPETIISELEKLKESDK
jgi:peroxiredoxin